MVANETMLALRGGGRDWCALWFAFLTADRPIGVSTAIARTGGMLEEVVLPGHVGANAYFAKFKPAIDWEWMLVLGLAQGAYVSSRLSGDPSPDQVAPLWGGRFGFPRPKRYVVAFLGGVILMIGARLAGGCNSGHGISGSLQLALSGRLLFASIFAFGLIPAHALYGKDGSRG
jgi:uncharacterized protein